MTFSKIHNTCQNIAFIFETIFFVTVYIVVYPRLSLYTLVSFNKSWVTFCAQCVCDQTFSALCQQRGNRVNRKHYCVGCCYCFPTIVRGYHLILYTPSNRWSSKRIMLHSSCESWNACTQNTPVYNKKWFSKLTNTTLDNRI